MMAYMILVKCILLLSLSMVTISIIYQVVCLTLSNMKASYIDRQSHSHYQNLKRGASNGVVIFRCITYMFIDCTVTINHSYIDANDDLRYDDLRSHRWRHLSTDLCTDRNWEMDQNRILNSTYWICGPYIFKSDEYVIRI